MTNWLPTFPLLNRPPSPPDPRDLLAELDGWSIDELMRNERFAQAPDEPLPPTSSLNARPEPAAAWQPDWLANAQWQATPETAPWPEPPSMPRSTVSVGPFERAPSPLGRRTPRRSPIGPPFLNEPPRDYPSHLGPVPQAPEWEEVVPTGTTPWSPLTEPPRATAWGQVLTGLECRRADGGHANCITPGGRRYNNIPAEGFPDYLGPGQSNYHSYNVVAPSRRRRSAGPGIAASPAPGPFWSVAPATAEGTPNPAAPVYVQIPHYLLNRIPGMRRLTGAPSWPVRSYVVVDQTGQPAVINVTDPTHPGFPGFVVRSDERSALGRHRVRNQGAGLSALQSPAPPHFLDQIFPRLLDPFVNLRDGFTRYLWQAQSENDINRAHRNSRYVNRAHRIFRDGLPLE
jgi:hypothetical protein